MSPMQKSISDAQLEEIDTRMGRFGGQYIPAWQWALIRARITPTGPAEPPTPQPTLAPVPDRHVGVVRGPGAPERGACLYVMAETADTAYRCTLQANHPGRDHWNKLLHTPRDDEDREAARIWRARLGVGDPAEPVDLVGALKESITAAKDRRRRQIGEHDGRDT